jgi:hypothetical protein
VKRTVATLALAALAACEEDPGLRNVAEDYKVVTGQPQVDRGLPRVDSNPPAVNPDAFASNAPYQVDELVQLKLRKVDILWVIDNSGSMSEEQSKVRTNFQAFIQYLTQADPPIDFHIGVVSTDTSDPNHSGKLLTKQGLPKFISCGRASDNDPYTCNVNNAVSAFQTMVDIGTNGSADEKGLLAAHLALTEPLKSSYNAGFLRADAALYVIVVSDEEDASCAPVNVTGFGGGCSEPLVYGTTDYYTRFLEGLKGFGNKPLSALAVIAATSNQPYKCLDPFTANQSCSAVSETELSSQACLTGVQGNRQVLCFRGCSAGADGIANYAPRYIAVANGTGGQAIDICSSNYAPALASLGFAVSGLRRDFPLSRAPFENTLKVSVKQPNTSTFVAADPSTWDYIACESGRTNFIRFTGTPPVADAVVRIEYSVNVRGVGPCN